MESFCCVGSPGVFITPGTYHVFMYTISSNLLLLFNIGYIKSWIYSNFMEIGFYSNKRKIEKKIAGGVI